MLRLQLPRSAAHVLRRTDRRGRPPGAATGPAGTGLRAGRAVERALRLAGVACRAMSIDADRLDAAIEQTRAELLVRRAGGPWWEGHLSSSAVSTATATIAFVQADFDDDRPLVEKAVAWLVADQNEDGGWGDSPSSPSNIAATVLSIAALTMAELPCAETLDGAREWIEEQVGDGDVVAAIRHRYGDDRTFQSPILAACALAGLVEWREVPTLPIELAAMPRGLHALLKLQVVSYGLPALIAVGALIYMKRGGDTMLRSLLRMVTVGRAMKMLPDLQPASGGFLEAAPLTAFVAMSLVEVVGPDHIVVEGCLEFLRDTVREDGSWPIDTNLSVWVTTNSLMALRQSGGIPVEIAETAHSWLRKQQLAHKHPFTNAAPGGWPWTHLPGGVPDADDTAGAMLEMVAAGDNEATMAGVVWLTGLQNPDAGWPTFCQGWGRLPFDSSSPDISAHVLRALRAAKEMPSTEGGYLEKLLDANMGAAVGRGFGYLAATQRDDGSWVPLWFGDQRVLSEANPVLGTARVLAAYGDCDREDEHSSAGLKYLLRAQNEDGGWGGAAGIESTVEQTAMAISALCRFVDEDTVPEALEGGVEYLTARVGDGSWTEPAPIGLYFASLWYTEALYPVAWTVEALGRAREALARAVTAEAAEDESY
ncbi:MAG: squalene--hopene cyclase [Armatimonadia bacterium]|nr:squalene--hopene cyclase [Armatimonadia bacterium]